MTVLSGGRLLPVLLASAAGAILPRARSKQQRCPRFAGKTCAGHGTCTNSTSGAVCDCEQGFLHADCSYAAYCPLDCSGHGVCRVATGHNKTLHPEDLGVCHCFSGYRGEACQEMTLLNASVWPKASVCKIGTRLTNSSQTSCHRNSTKIWVPLVLRSGLRLHPTPFTVRHFHDAGKTYSKYSERSGLVIRLLRDLSSGQNTVSCI